MEGVSIDDALGERVRLTHGLVIVLRASRLLASLGAFFFALHSACALAQIKGYDIEVPGSQGAIHWVNSRTLAVVGLVKIDEDRPTQYDGKRVGKLAIIDTESNKTIELPRPRGGSIVAHHHHRARITTHEYAIAARSLLSNNDTRLPCRRFRSRCPALECLHRASPRSARVRHQRLRCHGPARYGRRGRLLARQRPRHVHWREAGRASTSNKVLVSGSLRRLTLAVKGCE